MENVKDHQTLKIINALVEVAEIEGYTDVQCVILTMKAAAASGPEKWAEFQRYVMAWAKKQVQEAKN